MGRATGKGNASLGALDVIKEELPKFFKEDQAEGLRNVAAAVIPQDATDVGLMMMGGPLGKLGRLAGAALAGSTYSPEAEGITLLPAKTLRGALGDIARQVQDYISYAAKRGLPISNESLFFHEKLPFYISPSSGKLMAINPELASLYKLPKSISKDATIGSHVPEQLTELVPAVRNTKLDAAKNMEFLDMWSKNVQGKYRPKHDTNEARIIMQNKQPDPRYLAHELMHNIQDEYGLVGAKPMSAYNTSTPEGMQAYLNDWGEREARAAEGVINNMLDFKAPVARLPGYARSPRINIEGTNIQGVVPDSEEAATLEMLMRGAKENPFTFKEGGLVQMKECACKER